MHAVVVLYAYTVHSTHCMLKYIMCTKANNLSVYAFAKLLAQQNEKSVNIHKAYQSKTYQRCVNLTFASPSRML